MKQVKLVIVIVLIIILGIILKNVLGNSEDSIKRKMKKTIEKLSGYEIEIESFNSNSGRTAFDKQKYTATAKIKQTGEEFNIYYNGDIISHDYINSKNKLELEENVNKIISNTTNGLDSKYEIIYMPFKEEKIWDFDNLKEYLKKTETLVDIKISNIGMESAADKIVTMEDKLDSQNIKYIITLEQKGKSSTLISLSGNRKEKEDIIEWMREN